MKKMITFSLMWLLVSALFGQVPNWDKILADIDSQANFYNIDFSARYTVVSSRPGQDNSVIVARIFRRDREEKMTILISDPPAQRGQGYLQIGDSLWFYDPESREFAFSSFKESFQNSDAQNSDFTRSSLREDYRVTEHEDGKLGRFDVWIATLDAVNNAVPVPRRKMWIRKDNNLILKVEDYSVSRRLLRTILFPSYQSVQGRFIPTRFVIEDALRQGEKTQITIEEPSIAPIPDSVFRREYLERVSR